MLNSAETFARRIVERLQSAGHVAYFAGGCVRDRLMGRPPKDFDVATSARPEQVLTLFPRGQQVGAAFGVILIVEGRAVARLQVEVATFRADGTYSDGRRPDSVRFTTAQEDAQRRDFTCNGLFLDPIAGQLHDFVGGQADIEAKLLRAIGDPAARFAEDHLRMLRAVRFAAKLEFAIEAETGAAIGRLAQNIRSVSRERVHDELAAMLSHPARAKAAQLLQSTGLLKYVWPPELMKDENRWAHFSGAGLNALPPGADFVMVLVPLCQELAGMSLPLTPAQAGDFLRRDLMLSNVETADFAWLMEKLSLLEDGRWRTLPKSVMKRLMADARWPRLESLLVTLWPDPGSNQVFRSRIQRLLSEGVAPDPFITGDTLIQLGAAPSPKFKGWLEKLYDHQLDGELQTPEQALVAARRLIAEA